MRIGRPNPVGEWETVHENKRIVLETDQGEFSLSINVYGDLEILGMAADDSGRQNALDIHPEARNKISLSFAKNN